MVCTHPITLKSGEEVPCGKCVSCLANQRQEWVFRLKREYESCSFGLFVTLTYDDEHLPPDGVCKRDVQLFLKRLRKHFPPSEVRYYLVSEYGDNTHRAHYHGLFFFKNKPSNKLEMYDIFESSWSNGFVGFGDIEEGSIVYCTKYCLKKCSVPEGKNAVFRLMSKMNGCIGHEYLDSMSDYHVSSMNFQYVVADGKRCRIPSAYKSKLLDKKFGKLRSLNPLYQDYRQKRFDSFYSSQIESANKLAFDFFSEHKFSSFVEAVEAFNKHILSKKDRSEELILKHTKKQVL